MTPDKTEALRQRLIELRQDALAQLVEAVPVLDLAMLRIVADIGAVLAALEDEAEPPES